MPIGAFRIPQICTHLSSHARGLINSRETLPNCFAPIDVLVTFVETSTNGYGTQYLLETLKRLEKKLCLLKKENLEHWGNLVDHNILPATT
jgi:hypothetical protein